MTPEIYWVDQVAFDRVAPDRVAPLRLALMPRPRGADWLADEIRGWRQHGIDTVVSLLESHEVRELALQDEASLCKAQGIDFLSFPTLDRGTPSSISATAALVTKLVEQLHAGRAVAVHCRAGIGRSSLICACILHALGVASADIFPLLSRARGLAVPDTTSQIDWLSKFQRHCKAQEHN